MAEYVGTILMPFLRLVMLPLLIFSGYYLLSAFQISFPNAFTHPLLLALSIRSSHPYPLPFPVPPTHLGPPYASALGRLSLGQIQRERDEKEKRSSF